MTTRMIALCTALLLFLTPLVAGAEAASSAPDTTTSATQTLTGKGGKPQRGPARNADANAGKQEDTPTPSVPETSEEGETAPASPKKPQQQENTDSTGKRQAGRGKAETGSQTARTGKNPEGAKGTQKSGTAQAEGKTGRTAKSSDAQGREAFVKLLLDNGLIDQTTYDAIIKWLSASGTGSKT